jgi:hypothetical protein
LQWCASLRDYIYKDKINVCRFSRQGRWTNGLSSSALSSQALVVFGCPWQGEARTLVMRMPKRSIPRAAMSMQGPGVCFPSGEGVVAPSLPLRSGRSGTVLARTDIAPSSPRRNSRVARMKMIIAVHTLPSASLFPQSSQSPLLLEPCLVEEHPETGTGSTDRAVCLLFSIQPGGFHRCPGSRV